MATWEVRGLGAETVVDYSGDDTVEQVLRLHPGGVDVVIDLVNRGPALEGTATAVKPGGRLLSPLDHPGELDRGVRASYIGLDGGEALLADLVDRAAAGTLTVEVGASYPLVEAGQAVADFVAKHTRGKVVISC